MISLKKYITRIQQSTIIKGTLILTAAGFATRIIGFLFRIFLTDKIGAEGLGIYQLIFPIQIICYSICTIGFETSISKMTAATIHHDSIPSKRYLKYGIVMSFLLSVVMSTLLFQCSDWICEHVLLEVRCNILIKALAFSIPLTSIHACICGYYIGCKNTNITAVSQIVEQLARVISIVVIIDYMEKSGATPTPLCAVIGSVSGELIATFFCAFHIIRHIRLSKKKLSKNAVTYGIDFIKKRRLILSEIITLALPISLNRLMLSVLQSIQSILIPNMLILYGYSSQKALSVYGILLGLVIPFILFPGAFINSLSLLLLPTISQADSADNEAGIKKTTEKTLHFCCVFGIFCAAVFIHYGRDIGLTMLSDKEAGTYMCLLGIICPFIYVTSTLASIINGLGKTTVTFLFGVMATILQIISIVTLMPIYGVYGYLLGFIGSNMLNALCLYLYIRRQIHISLRLFHSIVYPALTAFVIMKGITFLLSLVFTKMTLPVMAVSMNLVTVLYIWLLKEDF